MTNRLIQMPAYQLNKFKAIINYQESGYLVVSNIKDYLPNLDRGCNVAGHYSPDAGCYIIRKHNKHKIIGHEDYPYPLQLVTAKLFRNYIQVEEINIDLSDASDIIAFVNKQLTKARCPYVVYEIEVIEEPTPMLFITNQHAAVHASRVIWDAENNQLVAATLVSSTKMTLKAILASLSTNSKQILRISGAGRNIHVENAQRGYIQIPHEIRGGYAVSIYHPVCGDPRLSSEPYFYSIGGANAFIDRLQTALPWPFKREWFDYVIKKALEINLVAKLDSLGEYPPAYRAFTGRDGVGVGWEDILGAGLVSRKLHIQEQSDDPKND